MNVVFVKVTIKHVLIALELQMVQHMLISEEHEMMILQTIVCKIVQENMVVMLFLMNVVFVKEQVSQMDSVIVAAKL